LKTIDLELLKSLGPQLGVSDRFEQQKYFILIQEELKLLEETALAEAESGRKKWSYGGFILGRSLLSCFYKISDQVTYEGGQADDEY
jgi:hypothetical protein